MWYYEHLANQRRCSNLTVMDPVGFVPPPLLFWGYVLQYLQSLKGGCSSISDNLSCSSLALTVLQTYYSLLLPIILATLKNISSQLTSAADSRCYNLTFLVIFIKAVCMSLCRHIYYIVECDEKISKPN